MEKITLNPHAKLQEMCDCYLETDYRKVLAGMSGGPSADLEEDAMKYLAVAIMYAITDQASKLAIKRKGTEAKASVEAKEKESLPAPTPELADKMIEIVRAICHLDEDKGEMPLSLGLRNGQVDVKVKVKREGEKNSLKLKF